MTDRFRNILVVTSPGILHSDALQAAFEVADTHGARLTVLDVVEPPPRLRWANVRRRTTDVHARLPSNRLEFVRGVVADLRGSESIDVQVVVGELHVEVVAHALEHHHDLVIVVSGVGATSDIQVVPNHVTQLLRKCPVPVWVMRAPHSGGIRVLALIDPDPDDPVRDGLNARVLELAASLARNGDGELHLGHALERAGELASPPTPEVLDQGGRAVARADSAHGLHDDRIGEMLRRHADVESDVDVHLVVGHAGEALPALAAELSADLVVMGTVARTGISGLIIGNSAETMLSSVACSVLAVKPDDLVAAVAPVAEMVA